MLIKYSKNLVKYIKIIYSSKKQFRKNCSIYNIIVKQKVRVKKLRKVT